MPSTRQILVIDDDDAIREVAQASLELVGGYEVARASSGGVAHFAVLDAVDRDAVERHAAAVADQSGGIDVCFNATSNDDVQGTPLVDMPVGDVLQPVTKATTSTFTVATAAARHMAARGTGVILLMAGGREAIPNLGGSHVAWAALAGLCRQLAAEPGPKGIRVAWLLSPGSPKPGEPDPEADGLLLPRRPSYADVANAAVFAASDWAATMTATEINLTGGAVVD
ncbi:MAG: SDR family oxidoreductase [Actinomycetota bacterium]|nr:SDR family oxidoreductase [Actinomycetota bacterium]